MKRFWTVFLTFVALATVTLQAQIQTPVRVKVALEKVSDTEVQVVYSLTMDRGWHVYSMNLPEDGPTSAAFVAEKLEGAKLNGALKAEGKEHEAYDQNFDMTLRYFEKEVRFVQMVTLSGGPYLIKGYL